tara:strand:+ start:342 stop:803 length:462 start_codon:yes stop_codon:yes gene_type:complete
MLRISKLADYGTVVMVYLAHHEHEVCNARDIAVKTHLALPTVSKILKRLASHGLLLSIRGASGGYRLKRPARQISVAEIIYALEEHRGLTECSTTHNECSLQGICNVQGNWRLISQAIESALESVSLSDLAKPNMNVSDFESIKRLSTGVISG